jgi:hypothetical protein
MSGDNEEIVITPGDLLVKHDTFGYYVLGLFTSVIDKDRYHITWSYQNPKYNDYEDEVGMFYIKTAIKQSQTKHYKVIKPESI